MQTQRKHPTAEYQSMRSDPLTSTRRHLRYQGTELPRALSVAAYQVRSEWSMLTPEATGRAKRGRPSLLNVEGANRFLSEAGAFFTRRRPSEDLGSTLDMVHETNHGQEVTLMARLREAGWYSKRHWERVTRLDLDAGTHVVGRALGLRLLPSANAPHYCTVTEAIRWRDPVYAYRLRLRTNLPELVAAATATASVFLHVSLDLERGSCLQLIPPMGETLFADHTAAMDRFPELLTRERRLALRPSLHVRYADLGAAPGLAVFHDDPREQASTLFLRGRNRTGDRGPLLDLHVRHLYEEFAAAPPRPFIIRWANSLVAAFPGLV